MQDARARVTIALRLEAELAILVVDQDQLLVHVGDDFLTRH